MLIKLGHSCPVLKIHKNINMKPSSNVEIEHFTKTTVTNSERWLQKDYNVVISLHHYIALTFWLSYYLCCIYIYTNVVHLANACVWPWTHIPTLFPAAGFVYTKCPLVSKLLGWIMSTERWDFVGTTGLIYKLRHMCVHQWFTGAYFQFTMITCHNKRRRTLKINNGMQP